MTQRNDDEARRRRRAASMLARLDGPGQAAGCWADRVCALPMAPGASGGAERRRLLRPPRVPTDLKPSKQATMMPVYRKLRVLNRVPAA